MLFINGYTDKERYSIVDVFGRDKFYYRNSTVRIIAWDTDVSTFVMTHKGIMLMLKESLLMYAAGFENMPFECSMPEPFYSLRKEDYYSEDAKKKRRYKYAFEQYKKSVDMFNPRVVRPDELNHKTDVKYLTDRYLIAQNVYNQKTRKISNWIPVDVDTVLLDDSHYFDDQVDSSCKVIDFMSNIKFGDVGFDKLLYSFDISQSDDWDDTKTHRSYKLYHIDGDFQELAVPQWMERVPLLRQCVFLRDYIILPDNTCVSYDGTELVNQTVHYKKIAFVNKVISNFVDRDGEVHPTALSLEFKVNRWLDKVTLNFVENLVVPHVYSTGFLNKESLKQFQILKKIIREASLSDDFETVYENITALNGYSIYGGEEKNLCAESILNAIATLQKSMSLDDFLELVKNKNELKKAVALKQGKTFVEYHLSEEKLDEILSSRGSEMVFDSDDFLENVHEDMLLELKSNTKTSLAVATKSDDGVVFEIV